MPPTKSTATDLYCSKCEKRFDISSVQTLCPCGGPILVAYDFETAARIMDLAEIHDRLPIMWRYEEILPVKHTDNIVTLHEGGTPLIPSRRYGAELGMKNLLLKDETINPTGSFKARGLGMAVSRAKELGINRLIIPTAGNAGSATAAYAAKAGLACKVVMPSNSPEAFRVDCAYHGAEIEYVDGSIADCGTRVAELVASEGWFSVATLKEPYRIEGKKTMGYELGEQLRFELPDVIIYPTGGGTGLIGMWKAFGEMEQLGWIDSTRPRMVAVQAEGCAPIPRAFEAGTESAEPWENPLTLAAGLRVPGAVGDFLMLRAIRESGGTAVTVTDDEMIAETKALGSLEGIFGAPEDGAALAALKKLLQQEKIGRDETVVVFLTGSGYKYLDVLGAAL